MPWDHCEQSALPDNEPCPGCGITKEQWTVQFNLTREFRLKRKPRFRLRLEEIEEPEAGAPYRFDLPDGTEVSGEVNDVGVVNVPAPRMGFGVVTWIGRGADQVLLRKPGKEVDPLEPVAKGAEGEPVDELQSRLCERGYPVAVDSIFGDETEGALRWFRADRELGEGGDVDEATWRALRTPGSQPLPTDPLRRGDSGARVRRAQEALLSGGHELEVDGQFGSETAGAVRAFREAQGLDEGDEVDAATWAALFELPGLARFACRSAGTYTFEESGPPCLELHQVLLPADTHLVAEGFARAVRLSADECLDAERECYLFPLPMPVAGQLCTARLEKGEHEHVLFADVNVAIWLEQLMSEDAEPPFEIDWPTALELRRWEEEDEEEASEEGGQDGAQGEDEAEERDEDDEERAGGASWPDEFESSAESTPEDEPGDEPSDEISDEAEGDADAAPPELYAREVAGHLLGDN